ncbi:MAG: hypothetical protein JEZ14_15590 [Marinilabiliaceae bacterium]|nr:hypothetical protein [Marinilabiliaceae bacterium]
MRKSTKSFIFFLVMILLPLSVHAQDCSKLTKKCKNPDNSFKVSASSRGIKMRRGKRTRIVLNVYGGREYYFSTYSRPKVGKLQFRIVDATTLKVLYDNAIEGLIDEKKFIVSATQKLYIEIAAPNWKSDESYECAAFKIAYRNFKL